MPYGMHHDVIKNLTCGPYDTKYLDFTENVALQYKEKR